MHVQDIDLVKGSKAIIMEAFGQVVHATRFPDPSERNHIREQCRKFIVLYSS